MPKADVITPEGVSTTSRPAWAARILAPLTSGETIGNRVVGRANNFDALRLFAALAVIFDHSVPLTQASAIPEPLVALTHGQISLGTVAVGVFFIVSGFLITQSWLRRNDLVPFLRARVLRVFPGLLVATAVTVLVLGPLLTTLPLRAYFADHETWAYILTLDLHHTSQRLLPGVFNHNASTVINGSLWTLESEVACYILVAILGALRLLRPSLVLCILGASLATVGSGLLHGGSPWLPRLPRGTSSRKGRSD